MDRTDASFASSFSVSPDVSLDLIDNPREHALKSVIVLNDHGWANGGQAEIAIESAVQLSRRGLDVCFVAGTGPMDDRLVKAGIDCRQVGDYDILSDPNRIRAGGRGIWNFRAARLLSNCLASREPRSTIIHVHGWAKALSPSIGPVVTGSTAAHVYTLHEYFLGCPNGGFYDYRKNEICTRRALGVDCLKTRCDSRSDSHKAWRVARQAVLRFASSMPKRLREIIYLAPEQRSILAPYIPAEARWHYLPNPAGPQPAQRIAVERNSLVLFVGRLSPEKGAVVAARAARLAGVPIAFCGEGESREAVLRANPDAKMLGWVPKDELAGWMALARCLLFPSLWYEGYPLVVADALRAGLPVIISKSSVATSSIEDGVSGIHVTAGDVPAWADAIDRFKSDEFAERLGRAAFRAGANLLGCADYTARLIKIYDSALARKDAKAQQIRSMAQ